MAQQNVNALRVKRSGRYAILRNWDLYLLLLPVIAYYVIFHYMPMYGIQIAFKDFIATLGITESPWVGFKYFSRFFESFYFWRLIGNTVGISLYQLVVAFPAPIILALMINEVRSKYFKKTVQMVTYAPHFLSVVVLVGLCVSFLSTSNGIVNRGLVSLFKIEPVQFMSSPQWFKTVFVFSGIWQNAGWGSIIYIAALAGIDTQLYDAAIIDGASKFQRLRYVTLPGLFPTIIILFILEAGKIMNVGFEKVFLMQNAINKESSDVISTYVYGTGILGAQYSFSTAVGLFNSVINSILLVTVNHLSKTLGETSLW